MHLNSNVNLKSFLEAMNLCPASIHYEPSSTLKITAMLRFQPGTWLDGQGFIVATGEAEPKDS